MEIESRELKENIQRTVTQLCEEYGNDDVFHPELGLVVKNRQPTRALIWFFKKLQRKVKKAQEK